MNNHKKDVKTKYDTLGSKLYDLRYSEEQYEKYVYILNEISTDDLVLDNGCGTGLLFSLLESTVIGIDLSGNLLRKAKGRLKKNHHLIEGDSENLPFRDSIYETVISVTVIQNLSNPKKLSSESIRVSKKDATIIISSLKKVYSKEEIKRIIDNKELIIKKIFTKEKINDWITISNRK